jgi:hypothetical protein
VLKTNKKELKMKNLILIGCLFFIFSACKNDSAEKTTESENTQLTTQNNFVGTWKNDRLKNDIVTISQKGDNYIIDTGESKLIAELKNDVLHFTNQGFSFKAFIDEEGILHIDSESYSRISE